MSGSEPVIRAVGLTKFFRDFWRRPRVKALEDLTLDVQPGEVFGLLGPNGSGKSTTMKLMLGLLFPTRGRVTVFGRNPRETRVKTRIGFLPEETYLYPYLTAEETLAFFARIFDLPAAERRRRADSLIRMVGLTGARKRPLSEFSKGMARRIGLAQALIGDPDLLILDEPTTGLDPIGSREVKDLILALKERGKTVFLSSHLLSDVEDICDRVAVLYGGRLRCLGPVAELLEQKQITQITAEEIQEETVQEVIGVIKRREGDVPVGIGHPLGRLEDFFLDIVKKAQEERLGTSGAMSGDVKSAFLMESARRGGEETPAAPADAAVVLARLAGDQKEPETKTESPPAEPAAQERTEPGVVEKLVRPKQEAPDAAPSPPPGAGETARQDVIGRLLKDRTEKGGGAEKKEDPRRPS